jgi:arabinogalactan oligomer/maltooligosaccharide transport system permease protein
MATVTQPRTAERTSERKRARQRQALLESVMLHLILLIAVFFTLFPIWYLVTASIRPGQTLFQTNVINSLFPTQVTLDNYRYIFYNTDFPRWILNSLYIATLTTIATLCIATPAAYAFSRFRFPGRSKFLVLLLALQSFPGVIALVPIYYLLQRIGALNHFGLILAYASGALVFNIWNMKGYFDTIPVELGEAALIDGATPTQAFIRVVLPLVRPVLAITALFGFLAGWNEYIMAQTILSRSVEYTAPVGLFLLQNDRSTPWGYFAAGSIIVSVPVMILFLALQRNLVSGLTLGGTKG